MEDVCILGAVHEDFGPVPLLGPSAVPAVGLLPLAHGCSLAARVSHDAVPWSCTEVTQGKNQEAACNCACGAHTAVWEDNREIIFSHHYMIVLYAFIILQ